MLIQVKALKHTAVAPPPSVYDSKQKEFQTKSHYASSLLPFMCFCVGTLGAKIAFTISEQQLEFPEENYPDGFEICNNLFGH